MKRHLILKNDSQIDDYRDKNEDDNMKAINDRISVLPVHVILQKQILKILQ